MVKKVLKKCKRKDRYSSFPSDGISLIPFPRPQPCFFLTVRLSLLFTINLNSVIVCSLADIGHHHSVKHSHSDKRDGSKQKEKDEKRKGDHFSFRTLSMCYRNTPLAGYLATKLKK